MEQTKATENSISNGVYFSSVCLMNVRCFGQEAILDLSDGKGSWQRWNILLGNNATGKTTLLQCLSALQLEYGGQRNTYVYPVRFNEEYEDSFFVIDSDSPYLIRCNWYNDSIKKTYDAFFAKAKDFGQLGSVLNKDFFEEDVMRQAISVTTPVPDWALPDLNFVLGYGASRFMSFTKLSEDKSTSSETLFNSDAKLINAEEWLLGMDYAASRESELKSFAEHRKNLIIDILTQILPGVTDVRFTVPTKENLVPQVEFKTQYGWAGIHKLSLGYKTMVAWIVDVAARMFERYPDSDDPLSEPVVILVDEIDLHLHPKWQRKIFDFLTEKFPRAQFIVTAHSPLVVQSAPKDANIILLRQETDEQGNAYVKIDNDVESVRNWRLDQILTSDLFGLESARNPEVEQDLERRTELLQKDALTPGEVAELERLNQMADALPTADNRADMEAMEIIRKAAAAVKSKQGES